MIKQLITDIAFDKIKLSQALTRTKLVENKIKNETLKKWLNKELEGYEFGDKYLPGYRKAWSVIHLTAEFPYGRVHKFPVLLNEKFGEDIIDMVNFHRIIEPISIVEEQIENLADKPKGYITLPPQEVEILADLFNDQVAQHRGVIRSGNREVGKVQYQNVIEQTKQKLLDTLMELENEFPNLINDYKMSEENNEKVQNIITTNIYGSNNPMNIVAGKTIKQIGNTFTFNSETIEKLKALGVDENQIGDLTTIVTENSKDKSTMTSKVLKWLGSVSASIAAKGLYDNLPALTEFVHQIIK